MSPLKTNLTIGAVAVLMAIGLSELALGVLFRDRSDTVENYESVKAEVFRSYSAEELDRGRPFYSERQGSRCIRRVDAAMTYSAYFGFNAQILDRECAKNLFAEQPDHSVVFLGGSVMGNTYAPNFLTTIDTVVHAALGSDTIRSINLAESGARSTNEMVRFLIEVVTLRPRAVVFLHGSNEFLAIRYGGSPEDDFYWSAGVKDRIERPTRFFVDKVISSSQLLKTLLWRTKLFESRRSAHPAPSAEAVHEAARFYVENTAKTAALCQQFGIKCFFFLQPTVYSKRQLSATEIKIIDDTNRHFPGSTKTYRDGYDYIRKNAQVPIHDLSSILDDDPSLIYFDAVHLSKRGNQKVGEAIAEVLRRQLRLRGASD